MYESREIYQRCQHICSGYKGLSKHKASSQRCLQLTALSVSLSAGSTSSLPLSESVLPLTLVPGNSPYTVHGVTPSSSLSSGPWGLSALIVPALRKALPSPSTLCLPTSSIGINAFLCDTDDRGLPNSSWPALTPSLLSPSAAVPHLALRSSPCLYKAHAPAVPFYSLSRP